MGFLKNIKDKISHLVGGHIKGMDSLYNEELPSVDIEEIFDDIDVVNGDPNALSNAVQTVFHSQEGRKFSTWANIAELCPAALEYFPCSRFDAMSDRFGIPKLLEGFLCGEGAEDLKYVPSEYRTPELYRYALDNYISAYDDEESYDEAGYFIEGRKMGENVSTCLKDEFGNTSIGVQANIGSFLKEIPLEYLTPQRVSLLVKIDSRTLKYLPASMITAKDAWVATQERNGFVSCADDEESKMYRNWYEYVIDKKILPVLDQDPCQVVNLDQTWFDQSIVRDNAVQLLKLGVVKHDFKTEQDRLDLQSKGLNTKTFNHLMGYYDSLYTGDNAQRANSIRLIKVNNNDITNIINRNVEPDFEKFFLGEMGDLAAKTRSCLMPYVQGKKDSLFQGYIDEARRREREGGTVPFEDFLTKLEGSQDADGQKPSVQDDSEIEREDPYGLLADIRRARTWLPMWKQNENLSNPNKKREDRGGFGDDE